MSRKKLRALLKGDWYMSKDKIMLSRNSLISLVFILSLAIILTISVNIKPFKGIFALGVSTVMGTFMINRSFSNKKKVLVDIDVVYVAELGYADNRQSEAKKFLKRVDNNEFEVYTLNEQFTLIAKWKNEKKSKAVSDRFRKVQDKQLDLTDILAKAENITGRDANKFLEEFTKKTSSKKEDLALVLACSIERIDYFVTFNWSHLKGNVEKIEGFLRKHNLFIPKILFPGEIPHNKLKKNSELTGLNATSHRNTTVKLLPLFKFLHCTLKHLFLGPLSNSISFLQNFVFFGYIHNSPQLTNVSKINKRADYSGLNTKNLRVQDNNLEWKKKSGVGSQTIAYIAYIPESKLGGERFVKFLPFSKLLHSNLISFFFCQIRKLNPVNFLRSIPGNVFERLVLGQSIIYPTSASGVFKDFDTSYDLRSVKDKIIDLLMKYPEGLTTVDIAKALNVHRHTVTRYVYELVGAGIISQRKIGPAKLNYINKNAMGNLREKEEHFLSGMS